MRAATHLPWQECPPSHCTEKQLDLKLLEGEVKKESCLNWEHLATPASSFPTGIPHIHLEA